MAAITVEHRLKSVPRINDDNQQQTEPEPPTLRELLDQCWTFEQRQQTISKLSEMACDGNMPAIKLLIDCAYSDPNEPDDKRGLKEVLRHIEAAIEKVYGNRTDNNNK